MVGISEMTKVDLEGKWKNKPLIDCNYKENRILIFNSGKIFLEDFFDYSDFQLEYNEEKNVMHLNISDQVVVIWQIFTEEQVNAMIIKINDIKYYFEKL